MIASWPTKKLGETAQLRMGETLIKKDLTGDGVPVYSADSLEKPWGYTSKNKLKFRRGAIVIGARGTIGSLKLPEDNYFTSTQTTIVVEPNIKEVLPEFLFYFLNTLNFRKAGTGIPMITISYLKTIKIFLPPLKVQQKIVERLDAIKKVQELNDKQIELAEELFQSLLHRELDPKGKNWEMKSLGELCNIYQPKTITSTEILKSGPYKVYGANGVIGYYNKYNHEDSEVLVTCRGATCGTINLSEPKCWITGNAMVVHPKVDNLSKIFLYYTLKNSNLSGAITGAAQPQITRASLSPLKIPLPPLETQQKIVEKLSAVQEYKKKFLGQKQKLQELFESVLNKSFKGQL